MPNPPTGTVTFLFTDIEGSTKRWEQYPQAMKLALQVHDALLREAIEARNGFVFKTVGDAFCAAFSNAEDALNAALDAQRALHAENWDSLFGATHSALRIRVALHTGQAEQWGGDYFGPPLNRVARLLSAGHGGQTLISQATWESVHGSLPPGVSLLDFGERRLKDLIQPEHVYQITAPDLPFDFPPLRTLDARPNNLPAQPTAFIGREKELDAVCAMLRRTDVRLVTLTGPGGIGKTRLSLQAAADMVDEFEDGVYFVNLAAISDPQLVVSTIAQAVGAKETAGQLLLDTLKESLREKEMLLLLDNFEQLVPAAPALGELLTAAPRLKIMVTSRELLRLRGEQNFPVPPLGLPPLLTPAGTQRAIPLEQLTQYESVRLFIERAQAARPDFEVTNDNAPAVAEICYRLDGLPLAIELAAARIRMLPPQAMLERLQSKLKLLTGGARDLPARQQTLRNAIEWSYDLLEEGEQQLFRRLSVFVGGRSFEAVEAVCAGLDEGRRTKDERSYRPWSFVLRPLAPLEIDVFDGLSALVDKSLLRQEEGVGSDPRFFMLVTIRDYALEKLEESGEAEAIREQHARYFLAFAEEAEPQLVGQQQVEWLNRLEEEHDNLRAALEWGLSAAGDMDVALRLPWALWRFWTKHGHYMEGERWADAAISVSGQAQPLLRARVFYTGGIMLKRQGRYRESIRFFEEALALFREVGNKRGMSWALNDLGNAVLALDDYERAMVVFQEGLAIKRELGDTRDVAVTLGSMGEITRMQGDYDRAARKSEEAIESFRASGDKYEMAGMSLNLGFVELRRGNLARAKNLLLEALNILRDIGDKSTAVVALAGLAGLASSEGDPERAARLFGAVAAVLVELNTAFAPADQMDYDYYLAATRAQLGPEPAKEAAFQAAWDEGQAMSYEQSVEYALEKTDA